MLMALGYTGIPDAELPGANSGKKRNLTSRTAKAENTEDATPLQFVTTTSTVAIDESSKRAIRKHASRYVYRAKPQQSQDGNTRAAPRNAPKAASGGQIHRFRLGPQGLKHTPNQPPQVSQNFEIISLKSDEQAAIKPVPEASKSRSGVTYVGNESSKSRGKINIGGDDEEGQPGEESFTSNSPSQSVGFSRHQGSSELVQQGRGQQGTWQQPLTFSQGSSLFGPSSGTMDPFNAMALPITPREQILLRYYCAPLASFI